MRPRISEFSYGFALTRELIEKKWQGLELTAAPFLPSLLAEGQPGGGFDVRLTGVSALVFVQFKLSHFMTRGTAKGVKSGDITVPYYRFDVHPPSCSDQHRLLLALEEQAGPPRHIVRYAAPAFYTEGQFDEAYRTRTVIDQSIFAAPSQIVLLDERPHSVGFTSPTGTPVTLSEPVPLKGPVDARAFRRAIELAAATKPVPVTGQEMERRRTNVVGLALDMRPVSQPQKLVPPRIGDTADVEETRIPYVPYVERIPHEEQLPRIDRSFIESLTPLDAIGHIAWTHFGCETIAIGTRE